MENHSYNCRYLLMYTLFMTGIVNYIGTLETEILRAGGEHCLLFFLTLLAGILSEQQQN